MDTLKKGDDAVTRCVVYTRFSPRPDASTSESCDVQRAYCEEHAAKKGYAVERIVDDPDVSGADEYRPRLWAAINELKKGWVLLVYKRDRLARNVYLSETIKRMVDKKGGRIEAVSGDVEGDGPEQTLVRQVVAAMAEYERKLISKRTRDALRSYMRENRCVGGRIPFGYRRDENDATRFVVDEREMATLREIKSMHDEGMSNNAIANALDPATSRSGRWWTGSVRNIVNRFAYLPLPD